MRAVFFHDHVFAKTRDGVYYSNGKLPYNVLGRYLSYADQLCVVSRYKNISDIQAKSYSRSSGQGISFSPLEDFKSIRSLLTLGRRQRKIVRYEIDKCDYVISRLPSIFGLLACYEAYKQNKPMVIEVVACAWDSYWNMGSLLGKILAFPLYCLNRRAIGKADYVLYVTKKFLQRRYPATGHTVGVSDVHIQEAKQPILNSRVNNIKQRMAKAPIFGIIGSLDVDYKGHAVAFRALASIKDRFPGFELRCVGGGDTRKWQALAENLDISGNIRFSGTLPAGEEVNAWIDRLDILLVPSLQEGLPRALIEAMSRGCPCLGARTGGIPELLRPKYIHPARDWRTLAQQICECADNTERLMEMAQENIEKAKEFCSQKLEKERTSFWKHFMNNRVYKKAI